MAWDFWGVLFEALGIFGGLILATLQVATILVAMAPKILELAT